MKKLVYITLGVGISYLAASCDLDKFPKDSVEQTTAFKTIDDGERWDNNIYSQLRGRVYGEYTYTTDVQADQVNATLDYGNRNGSPHRWQDLLAGDGNLESIWSGYYEAINNLNTALAGLPTIPTSDDEEKAKLDNYIGDAYLARAYYYFSLVIRWAKVYNPNSAGTDLGVPLVLEPDPEFSNFPARSTVQQVYDQILSDLQEAETRLDAVSGEQASNYFTLDAAKALEARVKLFLQDWQGAKSAAELLINANRYPLYTDQAGVQRAWTEDDGQEDIFTPYVAAPSELPNSQTPFYGYNTGASDYRPDFLPSQWVIDKFDDDDYRKNVFFKQAPVYIQGKSYGGLYVINKFPGSPSLNTTKGTNYNAPKVFRIAEAYLIAAEASFRLDDNSSALDHLNALRTARGLTALSGLSGNTLFQAIKDERFRELIFEGSRLDDLKRWGEGFKRQDPQLEGIIQTGTNYESKTVSADDPKFTWGVPTRDVTVNPNIVQNEGW